MPKSIPNQGGIIRVTHNKDNPYTMLNRAGAEDARLSWEARGVLFYLLCKPDGWQVRFNDLLRRGDAGREKLQRLLRELEQAGYLVRERSHNPATGRFTWLSTVYETPLTALPAMAEPSTVEPVTADPAIYESSSLARIESRENLVAVPALSMQIQAPTADEVQARQRADPGWGKGRAPG